MTALLLLAIGSVDSSTLSGADLATLSETELHHLSRRVTAELHRRQAASNSTAPNSSQWYVHKFTRATADPKAAADFMIQHVGAQQGYANHHKCGSIWGAAWPQFATPAHPQGLLAHFVYDPHKSPGPARYNATELGKLVEKVRGGGFANDTLDQYVDNHIGLVVPSLDPFVRGWRAAGVPFLCRTWCCGPGMPQYEAGECPAYSQNRTEGCETGCYVEAPHGIVVELQCGLNSYAESLACLTEARPETFDLCSDA